MYVPDLSPPSTANISLPSRGYRCLECGDSFALEKSLTQHCERRSVRIDVTCNHCEKSLVFYNKCSLLSHARSHKDKGIAMQCSNLILKPIPTDQMIITSSPVGMHSINYTYHSRKFKKESQTSLSSTALALEDETSKVDKQNLKCFECNEMFKDVYSLAVHYQQESSNQKTCSVCQMILPNQCSFLSHQRIHQQKTPYVCPECGAKFQSLHTQAQHVNKTCLHYTRRSGYRCVHCSVISTDASTLKSHIQSSHCEIFYKCPICPMAFKSAPGTHSHAQTQHSGVKAGEPKLIYKCAMCDTVFTLQSLLYSHLEQHLNTHRVPVFKCPECSMYHAQKQLMLDHIKATHGTLKTADGPSLPLIARSTNSNSSSTNSNHNKDSGNENSNGRSDNSVLPKRANNGSQKEQKSTSRTGYTCVECNMNFNSRDTYVGHVRKRHGKILKKHPCHHCEKSFCSMHTLCRHNRLKHKGLHKDLTCPQCPPLSQPFTKKVLLDQHIQLMHGEQEVKTVSNISATVSAKEMISPKRKSEDHEGSLDVNYRDSDSGPLKKLKVNILKVHKCAVCGFNTENITTFHEHIPRHKTNGSSYQCKEHLFIVHRLKEPRGLGHGYRQGKGSDESQRENQLNSADENEDGTPNTRLYDAFGKMGSNVEGGNTNQPGLLKLCQSAQAPNFSGKYCHVFLRQGSTEYFVGICVPNSCKKDDVQFLVLQDRLQLGHASLLPPIPSFLVNDSTQEVLLIHCVSDTVAPNFLDVTCLFVCCIMVATPLAASLFTAFTTWQRSREVGPAEQSTCIKSGSGLYGTMTSNNARDTFPLQSGSHFIEAFSLQTTTQNVLSTHSSIAGGGYSSLHGIRVLSLLWIMCGHSAQYPIITSIDNYKNWKKAFESSPLYVLSLSGPVFLAVDTFLLLGGLLSARSLLSAIQRAEDTLSINVVTHYLFSRLRRIQPLHIFITCFTIGLMSVVHWGPYWFPFVNTIMNCKSYWWANILLVSNLLPDHEICVPWTWYLSLDFQCYATTPLLVFLYRVNKRVFSLVAVGLLLSTIVVTSVISALWHLPVFHTKIMTSENYVFYYLRPYTRYGPFLIGIVTGIFLTTKKAPVINQKWKAVAGWLCCLGGMALLVGLSYILSEAPSHPSVPHALYQSLHRPLWALAVTWIILACEGGYGGVVNNFLSSRFWMPFSNISFACYMTHPVFIIIYIGLQETPIHYSDINFVLHFTAMKKAQNSKPWLSWLNNWRLTTVFSRISHSDGAPIVYR
ncbi:hypothetical protein WMY93_021860 [Mugilogobius chulae]|uniref:C2H2-type domain-containing protein n=1 Tax=Mugilogobius chulae TaxID=88201 RepID=A0AAW0NDD4_9GOBI